MNTLYIVIVIGAVLAGSAGFIFLSEKTGFSIVNIALALVTTVKNALKDSGIAGSKLSTVLDLIIQALTYVQAISDEGATTDTKVEKAMEYIESITSQLDIVLDASDITITKNILQIGFTLMNAFGVGSKTSYKKLYSRMAKYAKTSKEIKAVGMKNIR